MKNVYLDCNGVCGGPDILDLSFASCYYYVWEHEGGGGYTVDEMLNYGYDCSCVEEPVIGCTDTDANNYDPNADFESSDGNSCLYYGGNIDCGIPFSEVYQYTNYDNSTFTYGASENSVLAVDISGEVEENWDNLYIYNGSGDLLAQFTGSINHTVFSK